MLFDIFFWFFIIVYAALLIWLMVACKRLYKGSRGMENHEG